MDKLGVLSKNCARYTATLSVIDRGIKYFLEPSVPDDQFWIRAVSSVFLETFNMSHDAHFTWSHATKRDIQSRNPSAQPRRRPFPVLGATMLGPSSLAPYTEAE